MPLCGRRRTLPLLGAGDVWVISRGLTLAELLHGGAGRAGVEVRDESETG